MGYGNGTWEDNQNENETCRIGYGEITVWDMGMGRGKTNGIWGDDRTGYSSLPVVS